VRDLMFKGLRTFKEFHGAGEGIATNILSDRLTRLEAAGILSSRPDPADSRRRLYGLTGKGADLAPVLVELVLWSAKHEDTDAPRAVVHEMRTRRSRVIARFQRSWKGAGQDPPGDPRCTELLPSHAGRPGAVGPLGDRLRRT
jgi:DNA-binding HxlR family transcriptional regulator